uniref:restriction endonuclease THAI n=1 Tax=Thermoplasma acidophilum TaxID=2303 RepID=UPI0001DD2144|nr:Chain A, restriction endonuclease THAI [Thermoplasma acidophilum]3NDH_B Chain B, restriction endonuclease THAI [Thermoplasma acidophilum]
MGHHHHHHEFNIRDRMNDHLKDLFRDRLIIDKVQRRLPYMFQLAELESSRAGKVGMEVGSLRERIISSLLIYKFGEKNVETDLPITEPEIDVKLFGSPISIKTITGKEPAGVKLIWTVDATKARQFLETWHPRFDLILVHINWSSLGGVYYIPDYVQQRIFDEIGKDKYIKLPKQGTNPRGVEISNEALKEIMTDEETMSIKIEWKKTNVQYNAFKRWVDLWSEG